MILSKTHQTERYPSGQLKYEATIAVIAPMWEALYPNVRIADNGKKWIRLDKAAKYREDGSLEWVIYYDEFGNVKTT